MGGTGSLVGEADVVGSLAVEVAGDSPEVAAHCSLDLAADDRRSLAGAGGTQTGHSLVVEEEDSLAEAVGSLVEVVHCNLCLVEATRILAVAEVHDVVVEGIPAGRAVGSLVGGTVAVEVVAGDSYTCSVLAVIGMV